MTTDYAACQMPPRAPLALRPQTFGTCPHPQSEPGRTSLKDWLLRLAVFGSAGSLTALIAAGIADWLSAGGLSWLETALVALVAVTFFWVSLSVVMVLVALCRLPLGRARGRHPDAARPPLRVALLTPVHNEAPDEVFGNAAAMLDELSARHGPDHFDLFVLSDTRDPDIAALEERAFGFLRGTMTGPSGIYYRRRAQNTDKKVGNITDWLTGWGAAYDAMLVLDADSLMSGGAIRHLTGQLARDPKAGLIQTFPILIEAKTLFGRMQQFSSAVYGWLLADGLALWTQSEGNYWGHNAIIRTRAFAASAHLPHLRRWDGGEDLILSHDFVEAGMLRRAGWTVRFEPRCGGSYEHTPQTLVDYVLRDRRWCHGNLQHLRLLAARGFHPVSRFHLLQGAVAFLLSPAWLVLLAIWVVLAQIRPETPDYFGGGNPLYPQWPVINPADGMAFLVLIYALLLLPRLTSALVVGLAPGTGRLYGSRARFGAMTLAEIALSIVYAPILMVQQSKAVFSVLVGRKAGWQPQRREGVVDSWATLLRFHWLETLCGAGMLVAFGYGVLSYWLIPIALSLVLAVPLSRLSAVNVADSNAGIFRLDSPGDLRAPSVVRRARLERFRMSQHIALSNARPDGIAAE